MKSLFVLAFLLCISAVTDAQFYNLPRSEINSSVSFQVTLKTGAICASTNETFAESACSDPGRIEVVFASIKEVHWFRNKTLDQGRLEIQGNCQSDSLDHFINGINHGIKLSGGGSQEFVVADSNETVKGKFIELMWDLSKEGQAQGSQMKITNWQFCADARFECGSYEGGKSLEDCQKQRNKYKPKDDINEVVLELKFNITKFSAQDYVDATINCDEREGFAPTCKFHNHYAISFSEIATIDGAVACLPNEYPRINDCEASVDSIIYKERLTKKDEDKEKDNNDNELEVTDYGNGNENITDNLACDKSAITFALPRFKVSGSYDPCESLICSGNSHKLAFSLLMLAFMNMLLRVY